MIDSVERIICQWTCPDNRTHIGELVLDHNHIEFYSRNNQNIGNVFISNDADFQYKVVTYGVGKRGENKTLSSSNNYHVQYVLKQNSHHNTGHQIANIKGFSFVIPELTKWQNIKSVEWFEDRKGKRCAREIDMEEIVLIQKQLKVSLVFESSSLLESIMLNNLNELVIKNQPRIYVNYLESVDVGRVHEDINTIMQFWGLLVGRATNADDIRLEFSDTEIRGWLYINQDFSYNLNAFETIPQLRTSQETFQEGQIGSLFENWYNFCSDEKFSYVRNMYFGINRRDDHFLEEYFVEYVRILEGYHLRISNDEERAEKLKEALRKIQQQLKAVIFSGETKELIINTLREVVPEWTFNSAHASELSSWIASGFLGRISLADRLKHLDQMFFGIISKNSNIIREENKDSLDESDVKNFFEAIVCTRNYFAHYKNDRRSVLSFYQIINTNNVLKALIIMIFFSHMKLDLDTIRKILCWDTELNFQTMCLRLEGENRVHMLPLI